MYDAGGGLVYLQVKLRLCMMQERAALPTGKVVVVYDAGGSWVYLQVK